MAVPKSEKALENDFADCVAHGVFVNVGRERFGEYVVRSQKDLASSKGDLDDGDFHWCVIKAYQSLFFAANALLVKNLGYFSKDHRCIITALLREKVISRKIADELGETFAGYGVATDMDSIRIERNIAMYRPDSWQTIGRKDAEKLLETVRTLVSHMVGLL